MSKDNAFFVLQYYYSFYFVNVFGSFLYAANKKMPY